MHCYLERYPKLYFMLRHVLTLKIFPVPCLRFLCFKVGLNGAQESNQELTQGVSLLQILRIFTR
jgi:hypothetical protein